MLIDTHSLTNYHGADGICTVMQDTRKASSFPCKVEVGMLGQDQLVVVFTSKTRAKTQVGFGTVAFNSNTTKIERMWTHNSALMEISDLGGKCITSKLAITCQVRSRSGQMTVITGRGR